MRSRAWRASIAFGLVAIIVGLAAAELHCAFACRTPDVTAALRSNCHEMTADAATRLEGGQPCRDHDAPAAAIEPSGSYRTLLAGAMTVARVVPQPPSAAIVSGSIGRDVLRPAARSAPSILRI